MSLCRNFGFSFEIDASCQSWLLGNPSKTNTRKRIINVAIQYHARGSCAMSKIFKQQTPVLMNEDNSSRMQMILISSVGR
jgi:hypothetical protein